VAVFDLLALMLACFVTSQLAVQYGFVSSAESLGDLSVRFSYYAFLCGVLMLRFHHRGHYTRRIPWWSQVGFIIEMSFVAFALDSFTHLLLPVSFPLHMIIANWVVAFFFVLAARRLALGAVSLSKSWKLPVVIVGERSIVMDTVYALYADGLTGYEVKQVIITDEEEDPFLTDFIPTGHPEVKVHYMARGIQNFIRKNPEYFYVLSIEDIRGERRDQMMHTLHRQNVPYAVIPPMRRLDLYGMEPHYFFGNDIMLIHRRDRIATIVGAAVKRVLDVVATSFALPVIGLITVAVFISKRLSGSTSPLFYGGERVGKGGKRFRCWKFCTMKSDAARLLEELLENDPEARLEWATYEKLKHDPRVDCRVSRLLRKTSLDELPQLWSIFIGDMSLVGPRPILESQLPIYGEALRYYESVRPGLTGLWQVSGRNETSFKRRIEWDIWYVQNWVLWHDIVILFKTVRVFLTGGGAY